MPEINSDLKIFEFLKDFEWYIYKNVCANPEIRYLNGGFVTARIYKQDREYFYIELRWGNINKQDEIHLEHYAIQKALVLQDIVSSERVSLFEYKLVYEPEKT